jgi:hypothetical protein
MKCAANRDDIVGLSRWGFLDPTGDQGECNSRLRRAAFAAAIIPVSGSSPVQRPTKGPKPMASRAGPQPTSSKLSVPRNTIFSATFLKNFGGYGLR